MFLDSAPPMVTVIIPAYGVNAYIGDALDSVLAQSYTDFAVVVVNDGAPPEETAELKAIVDGYGGRVNYMEQTNAGQAAARNSAMRVSRSELVAFLDGDDYWGPDFLARQIDQFVRDPGLALAYTDLHMFGDSLLAGATYMQADPSEGEVTLESLLAGRCCVAMSTIVARRTSILDAGAFDESLRYAEDFDLWFRMAHRGMRMAYLAEPLAYRRLRREALSQDSLKLNGAAVEVLERFARDHELTPSERKGWAESVARLRSEMALDEAKCMLLEHDYRGALRRLDRLTPEFVNWKVRLARGGLALSPWLVRLAYAVLERRHSARLRKHVKRLTRLNAIVPPAPPAPPKSVAGPLSLARGVRRTSGAIEVSNLLD